MIETFINVFLPVLAAVDAPGILPAFAALTKGLSAKRKRYVIFQSLLSAAGVSLLFLWVGKRILAVLGIQVADFTIAGGILLLLFSLVDQFSSPKKEREVDVSSIGAVPIGVPLIAGPGVLTVSILLQNQYGFGWTSLSLVVNVLIAGTIFLFSDKLLGLLGNTGSKVLSKLSNLLLAAIGVMMIRRGVEMLIVQWK
jgi:multiple antibiotic resistance protein